MVVACSAALKNYVQSDGYNMTAPIAVIAVVPTGKASDEAKGSIQWKMTLEPRLYVKTADNSDKCY